MKRLFFVIVIIFFAGCAAQRQPIPPGEVPTQTELPAAEEQYGHEVVSQLRQRYPLDQDPQKMERVERIMDRLAMAIGGAKNPWHIFILRDDSFMNAAATRGNHIVVWTGLLKLIEHDDELATVLAHEVAHVLAGHTMPTPAEEASAILASVAGDVTGRVVYQSGGSYGALAGIAGTLVSESVKAFIVNPERRRKEREADHIGLFLMADAGYDPESAVRFWERVQGHPDFQGLPLQFLSTHPTSEERLEQLRRMLPAAKARYRGGALPGGKTSSLEKSGSTHPAEPPPQPEKNWVNISESPVYEKPDVGSPVLRYLPENSHVTARKSGAWLELTGQYEGFARRKHFVRRPAG